MTRCVQGGLWLLLTVAVGSAIGCRTHQAPGAPTWPGIALTPQDRLLILAPHPDDEVICCGGLIQQAIARQLPVRVVFLTYGDNNEWSFLLYRKHPIFFPSSIRRMGLLRHEEAIAASRVLGLSPEHLVFLGYPDFGTLNIWNSHWRDRPPFHSMLTRAAQVPYANAMHPGAPYKGEAVLNDLTTILREFRPTKVFVSHPGDYMPDHRALYLFTRVALWNLEQEMHPEVYPYLVHFKRWPKPRRYDPTRWLEPPRVFAHSVAWQTHRLQPAEVEQKRLALRAHRTQYGYSARYLLSFVKPNELFGDFPVVTLPGSALPSMLSPDGQQHVQDPPEELTDEERAAFVGLEWRYARLEGRDLVVSVKFSRPLAKNVAVSVFIFGYRKNRPFEQMPKLHVQLGAFGYALYDQDQLLSKQSVTVTREPTHITLRVPLQMLGDPERILTSARSYLSEVPLDWVSWRILQLPHVSTAPAAP